MTFEKFENEVNTLKKFFNIYCKDKHQNQYLEKYEAIYKDKSLEFEITLCEDCHMFLNYAIQRLQECPHEIKPRCRKCPNPCYEKDKYKQMAKMMRYSGMKLGVTKAANRIKKIFSQN